MGKIAVYLLLGVGIGAGLVWWQGANRSAATPAAGLPVEARAPLERRLSEMETALSLERYERQALAEELAALRAAIDAIPMSDSAVLDGLPERPGARRDDQAGGSREAIAERMRQRFPEGFPQSAAERDLFQQQRLVDNLVEAGLPPDRASYLTQRREALQFEALEARYQATQNGASAGEVADINVDSMLRAEIGDADYEKYLEGTGRPTTVRVNQVLQNSPAQVVGLLPGDEIVAYDGQRVFDIGELNALTNASKPGQTVAVQIERDGQPIQVFVESGPIGVSGGGRSTRRGR